MPLATTCTKVKEVGSKVKRVFEDRWDNAGLLSYYNTILFAIFINDIAAFNTFINDIEDGICRNKLKEKLYTSPLSGLLVAILNKLINFL